jgi:hypothetical protein
MYYSLNIYWFYRYKLSLLNVVYSKSSVLYIYRRLFITINLIIAFTNIIMNNIYLFIINNHNVVIWLKIKNWSNNLYTIELSIFNLLIIKFKFFEFYIFII